MRPRAKCHPDRAHAAKGMCHSCYSTWRYNNMSDYREARLAASKLRQRVRVRMYKPDFDVPSRFEGSNHYPWNLTAKDDAALEACLVRRGLNRHRSTLGGFRMAA